MPKVRITKSFAYALLFLSASLVLEFVLCYIGSQFGAILVLSPFLFLGLYFFFKFILRENEMGKTVFHMFFVIVPFCISLVIAMVIFGLIKKGIYQGVVQNISMYMLAIYCVAFHGLAFLIAVPTVLTEMIERRNRGQETLKK